MYARLDENRVAELLTTDADIATLFHPTLRWIDVTGQAVQPGWLQTGTGFAPPPARQATLQPPSLAELQAQLAVLAGRIAALSPST